MTWDAGLSVLHWWAVFMLITTLVGEKVLLTGAVDDGAVRRLARFDLLYGVAALLVLAAGLSRAAWGAKGWAFYAGNPMFWTKLGLYALMGLLSIPPTLAFRRWRRQLAAGQGAGQEAIEPAEVKRVRRWLDLEATMLVLIPVAAALMARGIGA